MMTGKVMVVEVMIAREHVPKVKCGTRMIPKMFGEELTPFGFLLDGNSSSAVVDCGNCAMRKECSLCCRCLLRFAVQQLCSLCIPNRGE